MKTKLPRLIAFNLLILMALLPSIRADQSYNVSLPIDGGWVAIANQLDHGSNTLDEVIANVPDGTTLLKWDCATQDWDTNAYTYATGFGWFPTDGTLTPGEGGFISAPGGATITFTGTPHVPVLPVTLSCGYGVAHFLSRQTNGPGTFENITGYTPTAGVQVRIWNVANQVFDIHTFTNGAWSPIVPSVNVGGAVLIFVPSNPAPSLTLECATNKTVNCTLTASGAGGSCVWDFDPPTVSGGCSGTNVTLTILSTMTNGNCPQVVTRTWQATDACSNSATCSQTVIFTNAFPLTILLHPSNTTATACSRASFAVRVSGSGPLGYAWYANGLPATNAHGPVFTRFPATQADNGMVVTVVVTNECNSVTSAPAVLTVMADTNPPAPIAVSSTCVSNQVSVLFSERVEASSATLTSNYQISNGVIVFSATLANDGRTVHLSTSPLNSNLTYVLTVSGVLDLCGNTVETNSVMLFSCSPPPAPQVFINEWLAGNTAGIMDPADGQHDDWFELYNPGANPVDLSGYFLTDSLTNHLKFPIPAGYVVPGGGFLLVWADNQPAQNTNTSPDLHVDFTLANSGGEIGLFRPDGSQMDGVSFGPQTNDISEGRWPDGEVNRYFMNVATPRTANAGPNLPASDCSSKGTKFWLAFPPNVVSGTPNLDSELTVLIAGCAGTSGDVTIMGWGGWGSWSSPFTIPACGKTNVLLPSWAQLTQCDGVEPLGIRVTAADPVSVHGLSRSPDDLVQNIGGASADGYLALPDEALGREYLVMAYGGPNQPVFDDAKTHDKTRSQIAILATVDFTTVTIAPAAYACGHAAGSSYTVLLDAGWTYLLKGSPDLTGTRVSADQPVAVFGGHQLGFVPDSPLTGTGDYLIEQMPPQSSWGKAFCTVPLKDRALGDTVRVLGEAGTIVNINNQTVTLGTELFHETVVDTPTLITANQPVLVAQFANGHDWDLSVTHYENPDPFMMLIPATNQFVRNYCFTTPVAHYDNYLNLIVPTADVAGFVQQNLPALPGLSVGIFTPISTSGYWGTRLAVSAGVHCLSWQNPFGVTVYGWGDAHHLQESYGYPADMCPKPLPNHPPKVACLSAISQCVGKMFLHAQVSDVDGDPLTVYWFINGVQVHVAQLPGGNTGVQNLTLPQIFAPGTYTVSIFVFDGKSPLIPCTTTVTTGPLQPPEIHCVSERTVECGSAWSFLPPTATEDCTGAALTPVLVDIMPGAGLCPRTLTARWRATDSKGRSSECAQVVTLVDTTPPVMTGCPADITVDCQSDAGAVVTFARPTATDLCSGALTVTCTPAPGSTFPIGKTVVTCTATDECENTTTCTFNVTVRAQGQWVWARQGVGVFGDSGKAVAVDAQGNVLVTGSFSNSLTFPTGNPTVSLSGSPTFSDMFLAKFNSSGNALWAVSAGGGLHSQDDAGTGVAVDNVGNAYVTGWFSGTANFGGNAMTALGARDIFIAKYDPNGVFLWAVQAGGSGSDSGAGIAWTPKPVGTEGTVLVTGAWGSGPSLSEQAFVLRLTGLNNPLPTLSAPVLSVPVNALGSARGRAIALDPQGNPYVTGFYDDATSFAPAPGIPTPPGAISLFIAKFDRTTPNLDCLWATHAGYAGASGYSDGTGIAVEPSGAYCYVSAYFTGTARFGGSVFATNTKNPPGTQPNDYLIAKLNTANGTPLWAINGGGNPDSNDEPHGLAVDNDGNPYVTGFLHPFPAGTGTPYVNEGPTVFVASYDGITHALRWTRNAEDVPAGSPMNVGRGIAVNATGCIHVTGDFNEILNFSPVGSLTQTPGSVAPDARDMFVAKMCPACCPSNPKLSHAQVGNSIVLSWNCAACVLESTDDLSGTPVWVFVSSTSPVTLPMTGQQMFFRLFCP